MPTAIAAATAAVAAMLNQSGRRNRIRERPRAANLADAGARRPRFFAALRSAAGAATVAAVLCIRTTFFPRSNRVRKPIRRRKANVH